MEKSLSLEYCHFSKNQNIEKTIKEANQWTPKALELFSEYQIQKCIMIDDIFSLQKIDEKTLKSIIDQLTIKPDCVYYESSFIPIAHKLVEAIDLNERDFIHSNREIWLKENVKEYRTVTSFLLARETSDGELRFSCPTLTAAAYLYRLGYLKGELIKTIYGKPIKVCDHVANILSSFYLQVEDKAQSIIEATYKEALRKISWFFY